MLRATPSQIRRHTDFQTKRSAASLRNPKSRRFARWQTKCRTAMTKGDVHESLSETAIIRKYFACNCLRTSQRYQDRLRKNSRRNVTKRNMA
jgi:hypothetical protein